MRVKEKIKIELIRAGKTSAEIARETGVSPSAVSHVIAGRCRTRRIRAAIAEAVGFKYNDLWQDEDT